MWVGAERTTHFLIFSPGMWESLSWGRVRGGGKVGVDMELNLCHLCLWSQTGLESNPSTAILLAV